MSMNHFSKNDVISQAQNNSWCNIACKSLVVDGSPVTGTTSLGVIFDTFKKLAGADVYLGSGSTGVVGTFNNISLDLYDSYKFRIKGSYVFSASGDVNFSMVMGTALTQTSSVGLAGEIGDTGNFIYDVNFTVSEILTETNVVLNQNVTFQSWNTSSDIVMADFTNDGFVPVQSPSTYDLRLFIEDGSGQAEIDVQSLEIVPLFKGSSVLP